MIIDKDTVRTTCKKIAPKHKLEWELVYAVCLQESERTKKGEFNPEMARLENNYYRKYVANNLEFASTSEGLLAMSWGIMQMMGLSLLELGFFPWYFNQCSPSMQALLGKSTSQFAIPSALDAYVVNVEWMIEWGCRLLVKKISAAGGDIPKGLLRWNGGGNPQYNGEVMEKYNLIKEGKL